jgi:hypothetical protein
VPEPAASVVAPEPAPRRRRHGWNAALVVGFALALVAPTAASLLRFEPFKKMDEKRELAPAPKLKPWSRQGVRQLPAIAQGWEKYFNDHFGLRKLLIGTYRVAIVHGLGLSLNPAVVIGRSDGERRWLYFNPLGEANGVGFESILGKHPYSLPQLGVIAGQLREMTAAVRATGAKLVIAVAPDKQTLYPEYLPAAKRPAPGVPSRLDQFWVMAAALPDVPLVDLRGILLEHKAATQLYYPSDTHWNWRAGALAYQAIAAALYAQDPTFAALPLDRIDWYLGEGRMGDLSQLMGLPPIGGDRDVLPRLEELPALVGAKHGKLLVIGDSFFELVLPFFAPQFDEVQKQYVSRGVRKALLAPGLLEAERPDVVIVASVERFWTLD